MEFSIVTSCNGLLYKNYGRGCVNSFIEKNKSQVSVFVFHENSMEHKNKSGGCKIQVLDYVKHVNYYDIFELNPDFEVVVEKFDNMYLSNCPFPDIDTDYLNRNGGNFYRKVVSVNESLRYITKGILCWTDCDVLCKLPFDQVFFDFINQYDICYLDRTNMPTESGVIFFNLQNPKVKQFINSWYSFAESGKIFRVLKKWADHTAFDYLRLNEYSHLNYGRLRSGKGRKVWYNSNLWSNNPDKESNGKTWSNDWKFLKHTKGRIYKQGLRSSWGL